MGNLHGKAGVLTLAGGVGFSLAGYGLVVTFWNGSLFTKLILTLILGLTYTSGFLLYTIHMSLNIFLVLLRTLGRKVKPETFLEEYLYKSMFLLPTKRFCTIYIIYVNTWI